MERERYRKRERTRKTEKGKTKAMEAGREGWVVWGGGALFFTAAHQGSDKPTTVHQQPHTPSTLHTHTHHTHTPTHTQRKRDHH